MKPEAQRIAIAEVCGWQGPHHPENVAGMVGWWSQERGVWWVTPEGNRVIIRTVPDYLNDLNAMHEAEKLLDRLQWVIYGRRLQSACDTTITWPIHAPAAQRAEAFLRTLNLWTDEE